MRREKPELQLRADAEEKIARADQVNEHFSFEKENAKKISTVLVKAVGTRGISRKRVIDSAR